MSVTFTKLFSSITESTVWCEPAGTRLVWIAMLAKADRQGRVFASVPGLANLARVTLDECVKAVETLLAPDPWSRTPDHDGRRIEPIDGGWRLLNHAKYRELRDDESRREQNREAKRRERAKAAQAGDPPAEQGGHSDDDVSENADSQPGSANSSAHAEAEAEAVDQDPKHVQPEAAPSTAKRSAPQVRFLEFWTVWPVKIGKKPAFEIWKRKRLDEHADAIVADVEKRKRKDGRWLEGFVPNATTYLNQERWNDELAPMRGAHVASTAPAPVQQDWRKPTESRFERSVAWAVQQMKLGQIDAAERDRLIEEARRRYPEEAAACAGQ